MAAFGRWLTSRVLARKLTFSEQIDLTGCLPEAWLKWCFRPQPVSRGGYPISIPKASSDLGQRPLFGEQTGALTASTRL